MYGDYRLSGGLHSFHFNTEEAFQRERKYVSYAQHIKIHTDFRIRFRRTRNCWLRIFRHKDAQEFYRNDARVAGEPMSVSATARFLKNLPLQNIESFANTEFCENVAHKLLTEMYDIPIKGGQSCIYKGNVEGAVIIRTVAAGAGKHLFLYGMSSELAGTLYNKISGMSLPHLDFLDEL